MQGAAWRVGVGRDKCSGRYYKLLTDGIGETQRTSSLHRAGDRCDGRFLFGNRLSSELGVLSNFVKILARQVFETGHHTSTKHLIHRFEIRLVWNLHSELTLAEAQASDLLHLERRKRSDDIGVSIG